MPHVGANTHETGSTQAGRTAIGIRRPQIVQTGNSNRLPTAQAARKRTNAPPSRKPSIPIARMLAGTATANATQSSIASDTPNRNRV